MRPRLWNVGTNCPTPKLLKNRTARESRLAPFSFLPHHFQRVFRLAKQPDARHFKIIFRQFTKGGIFGWTKPFGLSGGNIFAKRPGAIIIDNRPGLRRRIDMLNLKGFRRRSAFRRGNPHCRQGRCLILVIALPIRARHRHIARDGFHHPALRLRILQINQDRNRDPDHKTDQTECFTKGSHWTILPF